MINEILKQLTDQTGLKLTLCNYFSGVREHNKREYFNIILNDRVSESKEYIILQRFSDKYKTIKIEPNGLKRISIFF